MTHARSTTIDRGRRTPHGRNTRHGWRVLSALLPLCWLLFSPHAARAADAPPIPEPLREWVPWVGAGLPVPECTAVSGSATCMWLGRLRLKVQEGGAEFVLSISAERAGRIALPGAGPRWPQQVEVDGKPAVVLSEQGKPTLELTAGEHEVRGRFPWKQEPRVLEVPTTVAIVTVERDGRVTVPKREGEQLWLGGTVSTEGEQDRAEVQVFRKLKDGVPLEVTTRLRLRIAGKGRELALGKALLGGQPVELASPLPTSLGADGSLLVQVRAGTHELTLRELLPRPPERLPVPAAAAPWPATEVWSFAPNERERQVTLAGLSEVDPSRVDVPTDWRELSAFSGRRGDALAFTTTRRGEPEPPPNQLNVRRELWLDLDGAGWTVRDTLSGTMQRDHRLELRSAELGHVRLGEDAQLVTKLAGQNGSRGGVELRKKDVAMVAEYRLRGGAQLPAVGWSEDAQRLSTTVHLPPGWELLGASGADDVPHGWLNRWSLLGLFFVLVVSLAVSRLVSVPVGALTLLALILGWAEPGLPTGEWLFLLVALALYRALPAGALRASAGALVVLAALVMLLSAVPFASAQLQTALYPQSTPSHGGAPMHLQQAKEADEEAPTSAAAPVPANERSGGSGDRSKGKEGKLRALGRSVGLYEDAETKKADKLLRQDPKAIVQTGPGVPNWQWHSYELIFSGRVATEHTVSLWLLPPALAGALHALRAIALLGAVTLLLRSARRPAGPAPSTPPRMPLAAAAATVLVLLLGSSGARAEYPPAPLLDELAKRVATQRTPTSTCTAPCLDVAALRLSSAGSELELVADVHAGRGAVYKLPGPVGAWVPTSVAIDGKDSAALVLQPDGFLHLRVPEGRHSVRLIGPIAGDELTLEAGAAPHRVEPTLAGWSLDGVDEEGQLKGSLHLLRTQPTSRAADGKGGAPADAEVSRQLPPFLQVERTFDLGVSWTVRTTVTRASPNGTPVSIAVPLVAGEQVTTPEAQVKDGAVLVSFDREGRSFTWESTLEPRTTLELVAPSGRPWSEQWSVSCGVVWSCQLSGVVAVFHHVGDDWTPTFHPWPGEKLSVAVSKPAAAPGEAMTIDAVDYYFEPGTRQATGTLELELRASGGGVRKLTLPEGAVVQSYKVNDREQPFRTEGRVLPVAYRPGKQKVAIRWQQPAREGLVQTAPSVSLGGAATNVRVHLMLPEGRWLLALSPTHWGPALLFWPYVALCLVGAALLARLPLRPLRPLEWLLLTLGLSQLPVALALLVPAWFFLVAAREQLGVPRTTSAAALKNVTQLALAGGTFVFFGVLLGAVVVDLVRQPQMMITGQGSSAEDLVFYVDRIGAETPSPWVCSVPVLVFRALTLLWSLWLALSSLRWLKRAADAFLLDGVLGLVPNADTNAGAVASAVDGASASPAAAEPEPSVQPDEPATLSPTEEPALADADTEEERTSVDASWNDKTITDSSTEPKKPADDD